MNHNQNKLGGPTEDESEPKFNIMQVTADRYEDFVCNFVGESSGTTADLEPPKTSEKGMIMRQKLRNIGSPRSSRAYGRSTHRDSATQ